MALLESESSISVTEFFLFKVFSWEHFQAHYIRQFQGAFYALSYFTYLEKKVTSLCICSLIFIFLSNNVFQRRFRASNYQSTTRIKPFICTMPLRLDDGWNQVQINLKDFCKRTYGTDYAMTNRVTIHSNCRLRR